MSPKYIQQLCTSLQRHGDIAEYQLYGTASQVLKAGFLNSQLGNIYRPVQTHVNQRVKFLVVTVDGKMGYGTFNPFSFADPDQAVTFMLANTVQIEQTIPLAQIPAGFKPITLASQELTEIIQNDSARVVRDIKAFHQAMLQQGLESMECQLELHSGRRFFANSSGVELASNDTNMECFIEYNGEVGNGYDNVAYEPPIQHLADFTQAADYAKMLKQPIHDLSPGNYPVIVEAGYGFSLLDHFLLQNGSGKTVAAQTGKFTNDDFKQHKQVAHSDFSLSFDQLRPEQTESFNFSSDGIVGQQFDFVQDGKLTEPICNLEAAKELGYHPKVLGSTSSALVSPHNYQEFAKATDTFVIVLTLLGIHTQNSVLGTYSLPVPSALLVENGKVTGPVKGSLTGNFFDTLMQERLQFVNLPGYRKPALSFISNFAPNK